MNITTAYYRVRPGTVARTVELVNARLMVDVDSDDKVLGIEVIGDHNPADVAGWVVDLVPVGWL